MKLTTLIAAALIASPAYAEKTITVAEYCTSIAELAESIMTGRQQGMTLREALDTASDFDVQYLNEMVILAYQWPRFSTQDYQAEAILDFSDDMHMQCLTTDKFI